MIIKFIDFNFKDHDDAEPIEIIHEEFRCNKLASIIGFREYSVFFSSEVYIFVQFFPNEVSAYSCCRMIAFDAKALYIGNSEDMR